MTDNFECKLTFTRLPDISLGEIIGHMSDVRIAEHLPLLKFKWDRNTVTRFITAKEAYWHRDGLGHWAILCNEIYVRWGGFQKEGDEWDYGLVLKSDSFGLGARITKKAIEFALTNKQISFVTFLLPNSLKNLKGLASLGARFVEEEEYDGSQFLKYRLDTELPVRPS